MTTELFDKVAALVCPEGIGAEAAGHKRMASEDWSRRNAVFRRMRELFKASADEALRGDDFFVPFDELLGVGENDEGTGMDCPADAQALFTLLWCHALATADQGEGLLARQVVRGVRDVTDATINGI